MARAGRDRPGPSRLLTHSGSVHCEDVDAPSTASLTGATPTNAMETPMSDPNFVILYVDDVAASAAFYADLLGRPPAESSPTFAMFALDSGVMLGLWSRRGVEPAAAAPGGSELAFQVPVV